MSMHVLKATSVVAITAGALTACSAGSPDPQQLLGLWECTNSDGQATTPTRYNADGSASQRGTKFKYKLKGDVISLWMPGYESTQVHQKIESLDGDTMVTSRPDVPGNLRFSCNKV